MKNKISISVGLILTLLPFGLALAANDAIFQGSAAQLSVGGYTLVVTGSTRTVDSITTSDSNFTVTLQPAASFAVQSADRRAFTVSPKTYVEVTNGCDSSNSSVEVLANHDTGAITVTITPSSTATCGGDSGAGSSGGGGGGSSSAGSSSASSGSSSGGGSSASVSASAVASPSPVALSVSPVFNKALVSGSRGNDVKRLQQILGVESSGFFGALTKKALIDFQVKQGLIKSAKDVGAGNLGPKTRAKLKELYSVVPVVQKVSDVQKSALQAQIDNLNALLKSLQGKVKKQ